MNTYDVMQTRDERVALIKRGMYWPAFFFLFLWTLSRGMLGRSLALFALWYLATMTSVVLYGVLLEAESDWIFMGQISPYLLLSSYSGLSARAWLMARYIQSGYRSSRVVQASTFNQALMKVQEDS